jgi:hypothetical protein
LLAKLKTLACDNSKHSSTAVVSCSAGHQQLATMLLKELAWLTKCGRFEYAGTASTAAADTSVHCWQS